MTEKQGLTNEELVAKLEAIDRVLLSELQWAKNVGARNGKGKTVDPLSDDAVQWCLQGAAWKVTGVQFPYSQICMCFHRAINQSMTMIGEFNDVSSFPEMKAMLARAKEIAATVDPWQPYLPEGVKERLR